MEELHRARKWARSKTILVVDDDPQLRETMQHRLEGHAWGVMTTGLVVAFEAEDSMADVLRCLLESRFRRVPILRDGQLVGIMSRADLVRTRVEMLAALTSGQAGTPGSDSRIARAVMTPGLLTAGPDTPTVEAMSPGAPGTASDESSRPEAGSIGPIRPIGPISRSDLIMFILKHPSVLKQRELARS